MRQTFLDTSEQLIMSTFRADESIISVLVNNKEEGWMGMQCNCLLKESLFSFAVETSCLGFTEMLFFFFFCFHLHLLS